MSAVKSLTMRQADDFPVDLFSLNLDEYTFDTTKSEDYGLQIEIDSNFDWPLCIAPVSPVHTTNSVTVASPMVGQSSSQYGVPFHPEETILNLNQYTSPQTTPTSTTPRSRTPAFTPSASPSPRSSHPSSPYGRSPPSGASTPGVREVGSKKIPRHKRKSHIEAEQRRRSKIQNAFDDLQSTVPTVCEPNTKSGKESKSAMLQKTIEFCRQLRGENKDLQREADKLRQEMQVLTAEITEYQTNLPATGIISVKKKSSPVRVEAMFEDYIRARTLTNWKFWIFSLMVRPLFESYNQATVTSTTEEFSSSVVSWVQENLSLTSLRHVLLNVMRYMSKNTSIMANPERVPEEAMQAAIESTLNDNSSMKDNSFLSENLHSKQTTNKSS